MIKNKPKFRPFILLEILIAISIVSTVLIPLLYPQILMYREDKQFIQRTELDRLANLVYLEILDGLYEQKIPWETIHSHAWTRSSDYFSYLRPNANLRPLNDLQKELNVESFFQFQYILQKPKDIPELYYISLTIAFTPIGATDLEKESHFTRPFEFNVAIQRKSAKTAVLPPENQQNIQEDKNDKQQP